MSLDFVRVGSAVPRVYVADCKKNVNQIVSLIDQAAKKGVQLLVFPELCLTGYTCGDLFLQPTLLDSVCTALKAVADASPIVSIIGLPLSVSGRLYNCAAVVGNGNIYGIVPKTHLPNYSEFYESRWFASALDTDVKEISLFSKPIPFGRDLIFDANGTQFGIEICEDLWVPSPPSAALAMAGAQLIFNPSAGNEVVTKHRYRTQLISQQSARCMAGYVYAGAGYGESTTDMVFSGYAGIYENGRMLEENERFNRGDSLVCADVDVNRLHFQRQRNRSFFSPSPLAFRHIAVNMPPYQSGQLLRFISALPFVPTGDERHQRSHEIIAIQSQALLTRLEAINCKKGVIGVSGGLDSTLTLLVACYAMRLAGWDNKGVIGITMPGFGTGNRTLCNSRALMQELGCTLREISINASVSQHFEDIGHDPSVYDTTYENAQARERTQIIMDVANKECALALGSGDLSELALGWCTYNGDQMSMYNTNGGVPKTLIKHLVHYMGHEIFGGEVAKIIDDILDTPISPELIPSTKDELSQRTEDILGAYALHDFFLYHMMDSGSGPQKLFFMARKAFDGMYSEKEIFSALSTFVHRFFMQQFKRSAMPDGPKIGTVSLSPRGDWRMPSDASAALWKEELSHITYAQ